MTAEALSDENETEALDAYSRIVTRVAEVIAPSVANLRLTRRGRVAGGGSGVVITGDGFLLTSAHVVEGPATRIRGTFTDGRELGLRVGGRVLATIGERAPGGRFVVAGRSGR